ncbi:hypothetical protein HDF16_001955 [Granulicella aggregans]|uniref:Uncharacterized protein n=1 Tax=Granulicella aggregans TaxID=474949 RepID=A0A7W7ZCA5_9BACT|nr:hypothetical protein [Granulicella aggregans]
MKTSTSPSALSYSCSALDNFSHDLNESMRNFDSDSSLLNLDVLPRLRLATLGFQSLPPRWLLTVSKQVSVNR